MRRFATSIAAVALGAAACSGDASTSTDEPDPVSAEELEDEPEVEPEPEVEEPVQLSSALLEAETLGSGWSSESAAADPTRIAFTNVCGIPDLVLDQADEVQAARFEKGVVAVHIVYRVDDSAKVAEEIAAAIERCEPEDEEDTTRIVPVSFAGQGVPTTDAYRITKSITILEDSSHFESAWSVTQVDATTLSLLGMNASNISGDLMDPFPQMEEAVVALYTP
jgi:hypothetical protein